MSVRSERDVARRARDVAIRIPRRTATVLTILLALVPLLPILRDIPRWLPLHRLIWRRYYAPKTSARAHT